MTNIEFKRRRTQLMRMMGTGEYRHTSCCTDGTQK